MERVCDAAEEESCRVRRRGTSRSSWTARAGALSAKGRQIRMVDDDLDDDEDFDEVDLEDAADDEIDFVLAAYREDGQPYVQSLGKDLANDLDELIIQLRRLPEVTLMPTRVHVSLVEEVL